MTDLSPQSIRTTPGRDLIAMVIGELDRDAEAPEFKAFAGVAR